MKRFIKFLFGAEWNDPSAISAGGREALTVIWGFILFFVGLFIIWASQ